MTLSMILGFDALGDQNRIFCIGYAAEKYASALLAKPKLLPLKTDTISMTFAKDEVMLESFDCNVVTVEGVKFKYAAHEDLAFLAAISNALFQKEKIDNECLKQGKPITDDIVEIITAGGISVALSTALAAQMADAVKNYSDDKAIERNLLKAKPSVDFRAQYHGVFMFSKSLFVVGKPWFLDPSIPPKSDKDLKN